MKVSIDISINCSVFSGMYRFGPSSASSYLPPPDIAVYAKILTAGLLPLSTTLASKSIFGAFLSDRKIDALLHGHSYTANPIGCAVALRGMEIVDEAVKKGDMRITDYPSSLWDQDFLMTVSKSQKVKGAMGMGTVFAMELQDPEAGKRFVS
jgi:bifunctional dethiobiotin synthetase / adenosylmethionine---8-amino-7-oxononanoate aminotransferase